MSISTLSISLLLLVVGLSLTSAGPSPPKGCPQCAGVKCRTPLCADPVTPPGQCCPTCANSQCKFEGCVQLFPRERWFKGGDPCQSCSCVNGVTRCGIMGCPGFPGPNPCFGNPFTPVPTSPSVCCPRCDFGVPENECQVVPSQRRSFSISLGSSTCSGSFIEHKCDKFGYRENGKLFRCEPVSFTRSTTLQGSRCGILTGITYEDVGFCTAVEADPTDTPFSGTFEGCDIIVPVRPPQGPRGLPLVNPTLPPTPPGQGQPGQPSSTNPTAPPGHPGPPGRPGPPGK